MKGIRALSSRGFGMATWSRLKKSVTFFVRIFVSIRCDKSRSQAYRETKDKS
jgi:hypothetical protein